MKTKHLEIEKSAPSPKGYDNTFEVMVEHVPSTEFRFRRYAVQGGELEMLRLLNAWNKEEPDWKYTLVA